MLFLIIIIMTKRNQLNRSDGQVHWHLTFCTFFLFILFFSTAFTTMYTHNITLMEPWILFFFIFTSHFRVHLSYPFKLRLVWEYFIWTKRHYWLHFIRLSVCNFIYLKNCIYQSKKQAFIGYETFLLVLHFVTKIKLTC